MKIPGSQPSAPEALRALALLEALRTGSEETDVLEAFDELDRLPADVVRGVLETWTGPAPDPANLDPTLRRAFGFPPDALDLVCVRADALTARTPLDPVTEQQVRIAGRSWDGLDLDVASRLASGAGDPTFSADLEVRTFAERATGKPRFDVVLHGRTNGEIFRARSTITLGHVADGIVEMKDRVAREALQPVLGAEVEEIAAMPSTQPEIVSGFPDGGPITERAAPVSAREEPRPAPEMAAPEPEDEAPTRRARATKPKRRQVEAAARAKKTTAKKKTAAAPKKKSAAETTAAKKATATSKKAAAKKKTTAKKAAAAPKKAGGARTGATKTGAKKAAASPKKAAAKKKTAASPKKKTTAAKKATAKKKSAAKRR